MSLTFGSPSMSPDPKREEECKSGHFFLSWRVLSIRRYCFHVCICAHECTLGEVRGHLQVLSTCLFETSSLIEPGFSLLIQLQIGWQHVIRILPSLPPQLALKAYARVCAALTWVLGIKSRSSRSPNTHCRPSHSSAPLALEAGSCHVAQACHELTTSVS